MIWTLFVLEYDGAYDCCDDYEPNGITHSVYLIPLEKQKEVEHFANKAHDAFHFNVECYWCIDDWFEHYLDKNGIKFQFIGQIDILFEDRQVNCLADYIPRVIV